MLAIIRYRIICLPECYSKKKIKIKMQRNLCMLFCMGVKLGLRDIEEGTKATVISEQGVEENI